MEYDNFTNVPFLIENLDNSFIRMTIFDAIKNNISSFYGRLLDVGCGKMPYKNFILENSKVKEYIGLDIETAIEYDKEVKPDYVWNGKIMPFEDDSYNMIFSTEVLEHCPDPLISLREMYRVLKNDGYLFLTVPFLWPLHEFPHDYYRYTPFSLQKILTEAGFKDIQIEATGGWNASLAQMLGLWVRRSGLSDKKKYFLSVILKPVIKYLIEKDKIPDTFLQCVMITGYVVSAKV